MERYSEWFYEFTPITRYLSCIYTVSSYIVMYFCMDIIGSMISHPFGEFTWNIACLFPEFTQSTFFWILIWRVERSPRQRDELTPTRLFLSREEYASIRQDRQDECSIDEANQFESTNRSIIYYLIPLIDTRPYSGKHEFCIMWDDRFLCHECED